MSKSDGELGWLKKLTVFLPSNQVGFGFPFFRSKKAKQVLQYANIGFTLIELLVVVSVMSVLAILLIPMYDSFNNYHILVNATQDIKTAIATAQNNAISGIVCNQATGERASAWTVVFGSGAGADPDYPDNQVSVVPICGGSPGAATATYQIPDQVKILSISVDSCDMTGQNAQISFSNISGSCKLENSCEIACPEKINILLAQETDMTQQITMTVDKSGAVSISNLAEGEIPTPVPTGIPPVPTATATPTPTPYVIPTSTPIPTPVPDTPTPTPGSSPVTQTFYVSSASDDGSDVAGSTTFHSFGEPGAWSDNSFLGIGGKDGSNRAVTSGLRFSNVTIPQGATIISADFDLKNSWGGNYSTSVKLTIKGVMQSNLSTFSSTNLPRNASPVTSSSANWNSASETISSGKWYSTTTKNKPPSVTAIVQEIVNQPSWVSDNHLGLILYDHGSDTECFWETKPYETGAANAGTLTVTYQ